MKYQKSKILAVVLATLTLIAVVSLTVYAYFSTRVYVYTNDGEKQELHLGMNLQLLFDKLDDKYLAVGTEIPIPYYELRKSDGSLPDDFDPAGTVYYNYYQHPDSDTYEAPKFDPASPWGSPQNPYIISNERHLQNLSTLQRVGYFDMMYISENFDTSADGFEYNNGIKMPYFLVCTNDGKPVVIDGTEVGVIPPIGSAEHPFIGVVSGAFIDGESYIDANGNDQFDSNEKTVTVSTFHNVKVQTNIKQVDVGLFGFVGYMGTPPADGATKDYIDENGNVVTDANGNVLQVLVDDFEGVSSVIENLTLSDVQIVVKEPTIIEKISSFFANLFGMTHKFSYSSYSADKVENVFHENHHVGIFAGHVSYANVQYISVYYSSGNVCAIDLLDTITDDTEEPNYHSTTGIVGFMHRMNAPVSNNSTVSESGNSTVLSSVSGHCRISISGTSSGDVIVNPGGVGSGGGKEIGIGRGYVMAKTLYDGYHYIKDNQSLGDRVWKYTIGTTQGYAVMVYQNPGENTYVDQNGDTVVVASDYVTINGVSYNTYILRSIESGSGTVNDPYVYSYWLDGQTQIAQKDCFELSQTIWQYATSEPTDNNEPDWKDAVMLYETGVGTGKYRLPDSMMSGGMIVIGNTVTVSANGSDYSATIDGTNIYRSDTSKNVEISNVIFYRLQSDGSHVCSLTPDGAISEPFTYRERPLTIREAKTMFGTELCVESTEGLTLNNNELGNFYFYDGVFTFALSTAEDTIEPTWENDTADSLVLGANSDDSWDQGPYKNNYFSVVAFLTQIQSVSDLDQAIAGGKEIFIGYQTSGTADSWQGGSLAVMSLYETNTSASGISSNDQFTTPSNQKNFFSATELAELSAELGTDPQSNANYISLINSGAMVLNLESSQNLNKLKEQFKIKPSGGNNSYTFTGTSPNNYQLGLLERDHWLTSAKYSIWCGKAGNYPTGGTGDILGGYDHTFDTTALLSFNDSYTCTFEYSISNTRRYVYYDATNKVFKGQQEPGNTSALSLYVIEDMTTVATGHVVYEPTDGGITYPADQYILWPQAVLKQDGTYVNGVLNTSLPHDAADTKTDDTANTNNVYRTYNLVSLETLINGDAGWQDGQGGRLDKTDLRQKFTMQKAIQFGASLKIPNVPNIQIDDNSVIAPVGPGGASANIPTGSIAFRINKEGTSTIRVIVSVPVSQFFDGESAESLYNNFDYYLGLWKTEDLSEDGWQLNTFNQTSALQKFELPRSRPYEPGTTPGASDYILVKDGDTTYRCYLNGERVLVGYEFTVTEAGTYILGTAIGRTSVIGGILGTIFGQVTEPDEQYPMEIVYCSADGTASPGNDGTASSIYGSIDYVYSYDGKIVHVQDYDDSVSGDYSRYYNSNIVTFTQNEILLGDASAGYVNIQDFQAFVWRTVETVDGATNIYLNISVKSEQDAETALFYFRSAGYDPDYVRISVSRRDSS